MTKTKPKTLIERIADLFWNEDAREEGLLGKGIPHAPIIAAYIKKAFKDEYGIRDFDRTLGDEWFSAAILCPGFEPMVKGSVAVVMTGQEEFTLFDVETRKEIMKTPIFEAALDCAERYAEENATVTGVE